MHQFLLDISRLLTNNDFDASIRGKIIQKEQHVSHGFVLLLINIKILTSRGRRIMQKDQTGFSPTYLILSKQWPWCNFSGSRRKIHTFLMDLSCYLTNTNPGTSRREKQVSRDHTERSTNFSWTCPGTLQTLTLVLLEDRKSFLGSHRQIHEFLVRLRPWCV